MDDQIQQQLLIGGVALLVGLYGVFAPYRWNILRLKRRFARRSSDETNERIPKIIGTILILIGLIILIPSGFGVRFE